MRKLVIMRGVSGAGKTTMANKILKETHSKGKTGLICSADQFFVNPKSGEYEFDSKKLGNAHSYCRGKAEAAMWLGTDVVIVDNTNTQKWEFEPYVLLAEENEYDVEEVIVGTLDEQDLKIYANRNTHGVPLDAIRKMARRFQQ